MDAKKILIYFVTLISLSCFGEKYPIPFFIEDGEVLSQLYIEPTEMPFTGLSKQDRLFSDYMTAIAKKDLHQANSFLSPEMQVKDEKTFKWLMSQDLGKLLGVRKCLYNDHYVYFATTSVGQQFLCLRQDDNNLRFVPFNDYPFQVLCGEALTSYLRKKSSPKDVDIAQMSVITYGSNDVANLYFEFLEKKHPIVVLLKKDIQNLNRAYAEKDLDALPLLVTKESLGRMMTGMMNGTPDDGFRVCSFESVGVISMDPVYVFLGHREGEQSLFFRKFIKQEDEYLLVNYLGGGGPLEVFLESKEFKRFALNKYKQVYPPASKSKK